MSNFAIQLLLLLWGNPVFVIGMAVIVAAIGTGTVVMMNGALRTPRRSGKEYTANHVRMGGALMIAGAILLPMLAGWPSFGTNSLLTYSVPFLVAVAALGFSGMAWLDLGLWLLQSIAASITARIRKAVNRKPFVLGGYAYGYSPEITIDLGALRQHPHNRYPAPTGA